MKFLAVLVALVAVFACVVAQGYDSNSNWGSSQYGAPSSPAPSYYDGPASSSYGAQPAPSRYGDQPAPAPSPYGVQPAPNPYGAPTPAPSPYGPAARGWY